MIKKTDEFTGQKSVVTPDYVIMDVFPVLGNRKPWDLRIMFTYSKDSVRMAIKHESQYIASAIKRISFKFSDDQVVIEGKPLDGPEYKRLGYDFKYTVFRMSKDELKQFASSEIVKIRVEFENPTDYDPIVEKELKIKKATPVKETAACILQEVN